jgi:hypothetical protein
MALLDAEPRSATVAAASPLSTLRIDRAEYQDLIDDHPEVFRREDGSPIPFEEAAQDARRQAIDERAAKQLKLLTLDLHDDLEAGLRFEEMAATRTLAIRPVGPVEVDSAWLPQGPEPAVLKAVARLPVGDVSEVIETSQGAYVARAIERLPSRVPPLEEVRERLRTRLAHERAMEMARDAAQTLHRRLTDRLEHGWRFEEAVLAEASVPVRSLELTRTGALEGLGYASTVNEAAFATPLGHVTQILETSTGYAFVRPEDRLPVDFSQLANEQARWNEQTLTQKHTAQVEAFLADVRSRAKLRDFVAAPSNS